MKSKVNKYLICIIVICLILNIAQYINNSSEQRKIQQSSEVTFNCYIEAIYHEIGNFKISKYDRVVKISQLGYNLGIVCNSYQMTSYYKKNGNLQQVLFIMKDAFTNNSNLNKLLDETDITVLVPYLEKIAANPLDKEATNKLYELVVKMR